MHKKIFPLLKGKFTNILKNLKPAHYVAIAIVAFLGAFNLITGVTPQIKQYRYESGIEKSFDKWWATTGAEQFKSVGLEPNEKLRNEELAQFRERALEQKPSFVIEDRIESMKIDFREWWEMKGGRESFLSETGKIPTDKDFRREQQKWIDNYTDKFVRYSMAYVPSKGSYEKLFTSWILFPGILSYLVFAFAFIFAVVQLEKRFKPYILWSLIAALAILSGFVVDFLTGTSFFDHYNNERYMGMSLTISFLMGATAFAPKKDLVNEKIKFTAIAILLLDMLINWFVNPGIFGAVTIASPLCFGAGVFAGLKIETRKKSVHEIAKENLEERVRKNSLRNPMAELKAKNRSLLEDGFSSAKTGMLEQASKQLSRAMNQILQEYPVDVLFIKNVAERLVNPALYIEISSNQWMEWGEIAKNKNAPEAAILFLKKGLSLEKQENFARRALFILGETCVNNKIDVEDGLKRLEKVIEMNKGDILAKQAMRIIEGQKK